MKLITSSVAFLFALCLSFAASAQTSTNTIVNDWERAKAYTNEYLEAMPENAYDLKPTPEMRSFADQMLHLASANYRFAATAAGREVPADAADLEKISDKSKTNVTRVVLESYDFVTKHAANLSAEQLKENITLFGRFEMSREIALAKNFEHQTHHRGQTTVYLRLAGATPPQEKLF